MPIQSRPDVLSCKLAHHLLSSRDEIGHCIAIVLVGLRGKHLKTPLNELFLLFGSERAEVPFDQMH